MLGVNNNFTTDSGELDQLWDLFCETDDKLNLSMDGEKRLLFFFLNNIFNSQWYRCV